MFRESTALILFVAGFCSVLRSQTQPVDSEGHQWWQHAVFYEIYPRSFMDSNNDGIGDLNGISSKLDYLKSLGVDAIWITPCYPSPQVDFGYDVADYENIDPMYGTLTDFDLLHQEASKRGIRIIMDFVINHTSDQHPWFVDSRSSRTSAKRDWYIWRDGKAPGVPPNNWNSTFGGSAWTLDPKTGQYYYHYFYAQQAAARLTELGNVTPADAPELDSIRPPSIPALTDDVPEDDPHVVRAKLLANAGLNEYIAPEIQAAEGSDEWGAFAEAEIYHSYGEDAKAMRVMKRALPFYTSAPIESIPLAYWHILFPEPYWSTIESESAKNGLDPFMVASLIRQESEFNPTVVSHANAWGLMQLLPSVGSEMAHKDGIRHFDHNELLDPVVNIKLGTKYLRQTLNKFDDKPEYAFAAYNAGDDRVVDWRSGAPFHGIDEFVESIPFTETREYVQGIVRNEMIYRDLAAHHAPSKAPSTATKASTADAAKGME